MRKLALALLLSVTLPAFASVEADLKNGLSAADALKNATAGCETASCEEQAITDLLAAGVSLKVVLAAVIDSGLSTTAAVAIVTTAAAKVGISAADVVSSLPDTAAGKKTTITEKKTEEAVEVPANVASPSQP